LHGCEGTAGSPESSHPAGTSAVSRVTSLLCSPGIRARPGKAHFCEPQTPQRRLVLGSGLVPVAGASSVLDSLLRRLRTARAQESITDRCCQTETPRHSHSVCTKLGRSQQLRGCARTLSRSRRWSCSPKKGQRAQPNAARAQMPKHCRGSLVALTSTNSTDSPRHQNLAHAFRR